MNSNFPLAPNHTISPSYSHRLGIVLLIMLLGISWPNIATAAASPTLFGYKESPQKNLQDIPQWLRVLTRHPIEDFNKENKQLIDWQHFLKTIQPLPPKEQINKVNAFANRKKYVLDMNNYGVEDYWAIVREFLTNNGDCEDYSITKFLSLRQLGFAEDQLRIVVLQDTNLGIAHAVLAVYADNDIFILDNQTKAVVSHKSIHHYVPLFSVNENNWWLHLPPYL